MKKKFLISWKARDFEYKEKGTDWYWIISIIFLSIAGVFYYFFNDLVFALLILSILFVIIIASRKKPTVRNYGISESGFNINNGKKEILFENIDGYKLDLDNNKILLNTKSKYQPLILIPFEKSQNIHKVDEFLKTKIKEDEKLKIPILEIILSRLVGF